ncbi:hypothetical protein N657DRAFT_651080 [Parathielavia appendiculata]|uniref:Peptidase M43 pregnancy-associated plasma-A domain-containing protein n=1 Tax=Parathielavia appendiculata TaxID=2587402 RepID=A0AAN6YY94_9PEZI|nr:hypothetical protein N657DRAFT_651080 [Parathielavia appendiculata]
MHLPPIGLVSAWALAQGTRAQVFPISTPQCPVSPLPAPGIECGTYTHKDCSGPLATCKYCSASGTRDATAGFGQYGRVQGNTDYPMPPLDYILDLEDYMFYHMLHVEYLVEFSKNPMPFQTPLSLPNCGLDSDPDQQKRHLVERGWFKDLKKVGKKLTGTFEKIADGLENVAKNIERGVAPILFPWLPKLPIKPRFIPRPVCIPRTLYIPVHFTVFTTNMTTAGLASITALERQIEIINADFAPLNISFFMSTVNYHIGLEWDRFTHNKLGESDKAFEAYQERIKAENRYGGNDEVNVWVVESVDSINCDTGVRTAGYCTFARNLAYANHPVDGCVIILDTLPGVTFRNGAGDGKVLTHELGHWLDLPHVFPATAGCGGESDNIQDTFQFPNDAQKFSAQQRRCCATGTGRSKKWDYCPADDGLYNVTNHMSYSSTRGAVFAENPHGSMPWTTEQRAHMFAAFYTLRRTAPRGGIRCNDYPVWFDPVDNLTSRGLDGWKSRLPRSLRASLGSLRSPALLGQGDALLGQLTKLCSSPPDPNTDAIQALDIISGQIVTCAADGTCEPPPSAVCPDGLSPPCQFRKSCPDGSVSPCSAAIQLCPDGVSAPPCPGFGGDICPGTDGTTKPVCPGSQPSSPCPDGSAPPCTGGGGGSNTATCPAGCDVHNHRCDPTTAPTCTYPDPRVAKPRAACACRPGFKAGAHVDNDTTKQWRLPIPGQEHRVWVAEGVVCDTPCVISGGVGSCREVGEVGAECVGYP